MTTTRPSAGDRRDDEPDRTDQTTLARTVGAELGARDWAWIGAAVVGGALLVRGLRTLRDRRASGLLQVAAGGALVAFGFTRRRSGGPREDSGDVSADAHAEVERPATEGDPLDVSEDAGADEGRIQFSDDQTDDLKDAPDVDGGEDEDESVEVDISEAAMADEPGEAAGPTSEQAAPTTTKTDRSSPTDAEEPDAEGGAETDEDDRGDETVETEGGAEVHADTNEAGTIDVDEEDVTDESGEPSDTSDVERLSDDDSADYQAAGGDRETEETESGAEVHTDTNESGTMDIDEDDVEGQGAGEEEPGEEGAGADDADDEDETEN